MLFGQMILEIESDGQIREDILYAWPLIISSSLSSKRKSSLRQVGYGLEEITAVYGYVLEKYYAKVGYVLERIYH